VSFEYSSLEDSNVQSPEDREKLHNKAVVHLNQCKNLDSFYDVVFVVEDACIKANSLVL